MKYDACFEEISKHKNETKIDLIKNAIYVWKLPNKFYFHSPNDDEFNDNHVEDRNEIIYYNEDQEYDFPDHVRLDEKKKLYYVSREGNEYDEQQLIHQDDDMMTSLARLCFDCDFITMNQKIEIA
jgi:hypothetical protein